MEMMGHRVEWDFDDLSNVPHSENSNKTDCKSDGEIDVDSIFLASKLAEGILVGGNILLIIFSICGNIAALVIVVRSKAPRTSTKYFLICLALSDLLLTATGPTTNISKVMTNYNAWVFGALMCKIIPCLQIIAATMSAFCLMAIAVERNLLIVQTMSSNSAVVQRLWRTWLCPGISVAILVVPVISGIPQLWGYSHASFTPVHAAVTPTESSSWTTTTSSTESSSSNRVSPKPPTCVVLNYCIRTKFDIHNISYFSVTGGTYFLLLACFLLCYVSIYRFVKKHGEYWRQLRARQHSISSASNGCSIRNPVVPSQQEVKLMAAERHRKTLKLILGIILLHICCRFPNWVYIVITNVKPIKNTVTLQTIRDCLHFLSSLNSALNPFVYVIWNHSLRATANKKEQGQGRGNRRRRSCLWRTRKCCLQRLHHIVHSICSCCRYKRKSIDSHGQSSEPNRIGQSSSVWLWKTPKVYHISGTSKPTTTNLNNNNNNNKNNNNNHDMIQSYSTQPMYVSFDKSAL